MAKGTKHINRGVKVNDDREVFVNLVSDGPVAGDIGWGEMVFFLDETGTSSRSGSSIRTERSRMASLP